MIPSPGSSRRVRSGSPVHEEPRRPPGRPGRSQTRQRDTPSARLRPGPGERCELSHSQRLFWRNYAQPQTPRPDRPVYETPADPRADGAVRHPDRRARLRQRGGSRAAEPVESGCDLLRHDRAQPAAGRPGRLRPRAALRAGDLHAAQEPAGPPLDARDLRADLRDLQDLPDHAGQVHPPARAVHRRRDGRLLRHPARLRHRPR